LRLLYKLHCRAARASIGMCEVGDRNGPPKSMGLHLISLNQYLAI
jgi:hypothetical protein